MRGMTIDQPGENGHHGNVERSQETGVGNRGPHDPDLLENRSQEQQYAQAAPGEPVGTLEPDAARLQAAILAHGQGEHEQGSEQEADAGIGQGADVRHPQLLGDKGGPPDQGDKEHQGIGDGTAHVFQGIIG